MAGKRKTRVKEKKELQLKPWLISGLRRLCQKWPPYYETLNRVTRYVDIVDVTKEGTGYVLICSNGERIWANHKPKLGRRKILSCESCGVSFLVRDRYKLKNGKTKMCKTVAVDHVIPVVSEAGFSGWDMYIARMYLLDSTQYVALCRDCHAKKSNTETKGRANERRKQKAKLETGNES